MTPELRRVLLLLLPLLVGLRDPFQPPEERCHLTELSQWRYGGAAGSDAGFIGFIRSKEGQWYRVKNDQLLGAERRVLLVTPDWLEIALNAQCEPARWRWSKEGAKAYAQQRSGGDHTGDSRVNSGSESDTSDAGGGQRARHPGAAGAG